MSTAGIKEWFTTGYDLHKTLIVSVGGFCLVLIALLIYQLGYNSDLTSALQSGTRDSKLLVNAAKEIYEVKKQIVEDALSNETANIGEFFQRCAANADIGDIDRTEKREPGKVYEDRIYTLALPARDKDKRLTRAQIAKFCFLIESKTARAKVTRISLNPPARDFKSGERREDEWTMSINVTSRRRVEGKP